jgi:hypothetical protein
MLGCLQIMARRRQVWVGMGVHLTDVGVIKDDVCSA